MFKEFAAGGATADRIVCLQLLSEAVLVICTADYCMYTVQHVQCLQLQTEAVLWTCTADCCLYNVNSCSLKLYCAHVQQTVAVQCTQLLTEAELCTCTAD